MKPDTDLQAMFRTGYDAGNAASNPHIPSSRAWEAFELGRWMHQTGRMVDTVKPSRGDTWKTARGLLIRFHYNGKGQFHLTREY